MEISCQYIMLDTLAPENEKLLSDYLTLHAGFHYFQSPHFFYVCLISKNLKPYYIIAQQGARVVGSLLFFKQVQIAIPLISFLSSRTIIWGGPVALNNSPVIIEGLLRFYKANCPTTIYTQVRNLADTDSYKNLFISSGFQYEQHLNILVDLTCSEEDLWKNVYTKRRNQIRRAEKEGCTVEVQNSIEALKASYAILQEVYQRAKLPLPDFSHFESLRQQADARSGLRIFTVVWEGEIIGCMLCLAHGDWLFDYYAGAYSQHYKKYPNDLLPWAVFKWAKNNGFTHFDFGGAGKPDVPYGVRDYKKQFGGEVVCYGRYEWITFPVLFKLATQLFAIRKKLKI